MLLTNLFSFITGMSAHTCTKSSANHISISTVLQIFQHALQGKKTNQSKTKSGSTLGSFGQRKWWILLKLLPAKQDLLEESCLCILLLGSYWDMWRWKLMQPRQTLLSFRKEKAEYNPTKWRDFSEESETVRSDFIHIILLAPKMVPTRHIFCVPKAYDARWGLVLLSWERQQRLLSAKRPHCGFVFKHRF